MNMKEIEAEIERLEGADTTYSNCEKLSILYNVRDHSKQEERREPVVFHDPAPSSEFISAVNSAPFPAVLDILNEHFDAIKIICPKEYDAVLMKIRNL